MADGSRFTDRRYYHRRRCGCIKPPVPVEVAPARSHSVMVVRVPWGEVVLKPWRPKS